jgi:hypothetical protein
LELARRAVATVRADGLQLKDALRKAGWQAAGPQAPSSTLGTLLVDAKLISDQQLEEARKFGYETGMPIGKMLVLGGSLSEESLRSALDLQSQVRQGSMPHADAVKRLTSAAAPTAAAVSGPAKVVQQAQQRQLLQHPRIRLGDLLMLAGVLNENDVLNALELGLSRHQNVGESLVALGVITHKVLNLALEQQQKIAKGEVKLMEAIGNLQRAVADEHSGSNKPTDPIMLGELLRVSGIIDEDDITHAIELTPKFPAMLGKMLVVAGAIDDATLLSALRCQFMLRHQLIVLEDAVMALQYSQRNQLSFDDAIDELGIKVTSRERRDMLHQ